VLVLLPLISCEEKKESIIMVGFMKKNRAASLPIGVRKMGDSSNKMKRSVSVPGTNAEIKSVMRVSSLDESLHKKGLTKNPKRPSGIVFHEIRIREYARALGDNPSCSAGPPVSIGWEYSPKEIHLKLEKYEEKRPERRSMQEMVLPRDVRFKMLTQEWDVSRKDCAEATRQSLKVKNQRRQTVRNLGKAPKVEESLEIVGKKFKRSLSFGKKQSEKELEEMMKAASNAGNRQKIISQQYEWEPEDEDLSNGSATSRQESKSLEEYDAVGISYEEDNEHAPEDDESEPETARPPRVNPAITNKVVRPKDSLAPARRSLNGSHHGKPIIISEDDCVA
jgi:hypothetical protein